MFLMSRTSQLYAAGDVYVDAEFLFQQRPQFLPGGHRAADGGVTLFRPDANAKRFRESAERMAMPLIQEDLFLEDMEQEKNLKQLLKLWDSYDFGEVYPSADRILKQCRERESLAMDRLPERTFGQIKKDLAFYHRNGARTMRIESHGADTASFSP